MSEDGGETWRPESLGISTMGVTAIALDPSVPGLLYAAATGGLYRSRNGGTDWSTLPQRSHETSLVAIDPERPATVYANDAWRGALLTSSDRGVTWKRIAGNGRIRIAGPQSFAMGSPSTTLYAVVGWFVYRSGDQGHRWSVLDSAPFGTQALVSDESRSGALYAAGYGATPISRSTDRGATWTPLSKGLGHKDVTSILVDRAEPDTLYVGTADAGVFKTTDGGATWFPARAGMGSASVSDLAQSSGRPSLLFAATRTTGVFVSSNGAKTWQNISHGLPSGWVNQIAVDPYDQHDLYAGTGSNGVYRLRFGALRLR